MGIGAPPWALSNPKGGGETCRFSGRYGSTALRSKQPQGTMSPKQSWVQGFKNSPMILDEALHKDMGRYRLAHPNVSLLQYVDNLLIAADTLKSWVGFHINCVIHDFPYKTFQEKAQVQAMVLQCHLYLLIQNAWWEGRRRILPVPLAGCPAMDQGVSVPYGRHSRG